MHEEVFFDTKPHPRTPQTQQIYRR